MPVYMLCVHVHICIYVCTYMYKMYICNIHIYIYVYIYVYTYMYVFVLPGYGQIPDTGKVPSTPHIHFKMILIVDYMPTLARRHVD